MKKKILLLILLLTLAELESDTVIFKSGKNLENVKAKLRGSDVDVRILAEARCQRMVVEAIGRAGHPVRFTVKTENLYQPQPDLFEF